MDKIIVSKLNETYLKIECETGIRYELEEYFKFEIVNAKFHPKVQAKQWDGFIKLYSIYKSILHVGLFSQLQKFCESYEYELVVSPSEYGLPTDTEPVTPQELASFVKTLDIPSEIAVRDYQYISAFLAIKYKRRIIVSPTASGKSLILYIIIRYFMAQGKNILLVVPTTSLVAQMTKDFHEYSVNLNHDVDEEVHQIYSGKEKDHEKQVTCSTWQSIYNMPKKWFQKYDAVFCDEVHLGKASSLTTIMENCTEAEHKIGLTGSLDNSKTHKQMLTALYGEIIRVASTRDLIDKGFLSNININCLLLKYSKDTSKLFQKVSYQKEIDFLVSHDRRNKFIRNLTMSLTGNTLVLFNLVEKHGKVLYEMMKAKNPEREIYFVSGESGVDHREAVRDLTEKGNHDIFVYEFDKFNLKFPIDIEIPLIDGSKKKSQNISAKDDIDATKCIDKIQASILKGEVEWKK